MELIEQFSIRTIPRSVLFGFCGTPHDRQYLNSIEPLVPDVEMTKLSARLELYFEHAQKERRNE